MKNIMNAISRWFHPFVSEDANVRQQLLSLIGLVIASLVITILLAVRLSFVWNEGSRLQLDALILCFILGVGCSCWFYAMLIAVARNHRQK